MKRKANPYHALDPVQNTAPAQPLSLSDNDYVHMHCFGKTLLALALPVMLQSLISAAVNYADVWMLSCIDQSIMSAVSQANQVTFVLTLVYLGLSTGVTILTAQYWGIRDVKTIEEILGYSLKLSMAVSFGFFLLTQAIPGTLMKLYTPDPVLIAGGIPYLRVVGFSYLAMGLSQMLLASIKSMEETKICSLISSGSLLCNILLNGLSIFLLFPEDPIKAMLGVAVATVTARILEALCCLLWLRAKGPFRLHISRLPHTGERIKADFRKCTWQVQLNYLIWGGALSAMTALVGHVSSDMVSAYTIANSLKNLAIVACTGVSTAGGILLGKYLGSGRLALAKEAGDKLRFFSLMLGALSGCLILLLRPVCLGMVELSENASELLGAMLLVSSIYCIGKSFNSTLVGGIFCAGGDTRFGLICDTVAMWGVILPLGWVCAFWLKLPPVWIYVVLCLDEFVKMPFVAAHYRKYNWLNNLTHTENQEET